MKTEYPKMLYKKDGSLLVDGEYFSTIIVNDKDEQEKGFDEGFCLTPTEALEASKPIKLGTNLKVDETVKKKKRGRPRKK